MAEWREPAEDDTVIAHLSDLHFGSSKQVECWKVLKTFLKKEVRPSLVLVTGDIVDSPHRKHYQAAKDELDSLEVQYLVCAGNHDRHPKGNRSPVRARKTLNG